MRPHSNSVDSSAQIELDNDEYETRMMPSEPSIPLKPVVVKLTANPVGLTALPKDFYPTRPGTDIEDPWTEEYPTWMSEAIESPETAQYAIIRRHMKSRDARKKLSLQSIVVQSPLIKKLLGKVFGGYEGVTTSLERLEFKTPFAPFVHRWDRFREAREREEDEETRKHVEILWKTMEEELTSTLETMHDLIANGVITYELLWTMFEPGTLVYVQKGEERVMVAESYWKDSHSFTVSAKFVEWSGTSFGMGYGYAKIELYQGTKAIIELSSFPIAYHPDSEGLQKRCIARGRAWEGLCKYSFKAYQGIGVSVLGRKYNVDGRCIIDTAAFYALNPNHQKSDNPLEDRPGYVAPFDEFEFQEKKGKLNDYQLLLATNKIRGYSLKDKVWLVLDLANVKDIVWNDRAFSSLILPNDTKELILAFAQCQIQSEHTFDDVIEGKGKGIIILLSGPPGVGKTLTAEAVAESIRVPLYMMSAGDLGTDPNGIENALKDILTMTTKWKAILLLDEADVFLEARTTHDLERNKLVSIFLRTLEYFEGFLFLTSNRVDNIDGAFESRIHLSLQYEPLTLESRRQVWVKFLEGMGRSDGFTEEQIDMLATAELNGRQIKNILKSGQLLAMSKKMPLSFGHLQVITKLRAANACIPTDRF